MDIFEKTKELLAAAEFKTGEFIYDQKCNIKIARVCAELKKHYEKLGRLSYRKLKGMWVDDNEFDSIVNSIEALKDELECLRNGQEDLSNTICLSDEELAENGEENE
jgi:hypothetical protein